ncbi:hypothetical protein B0H11DRAFT_1930748 [Mycena galericulata]|nr:hypothetical protein B0H11DRAFT_1930748 [Mycena galericulata]
MTRLPNLPDPDARLRHPCQPRFFPGPTFVDARTHDETSTTRWYIVKRGRVPGLYTDSTNADLQTMHFSNSSQKSFGTRPEALSAWAQFCRTSHIDGCPAPTPPPPAAARPSSSVPLSTPSTPAVSGQHIIPAATSPSPAVSVPRVRLAAASASSAAHVVGSPRREAPPTPPTTPQRGRVTMGTRIHLSPQHRAAPRGRPQDFLHPTLQFAAMGIQPPASSGPRTFYALKGIQIHFAERTEAVAHATRMGLERYELGWSTDLDELEEFIVSRRGDVIPAAVPPTTGSPLTLDRHGQVWGRISTAAGDGLHGVPLLKRVASADEGSPDLDACGKHGRSIEIAEPRAGSDVPETRVAHLGSEALGAAELAVVRTRDLVPVSLPGLGRLVGMGCSPESGVSTCGKGQKTVELHQKGRLSGVGETKKIVLETRRLYPPRWRVGALRSGLRLRWACSMSTTSTEKEKAPSKKRGNPGDFRGARETFLNSQLPEYGRLSRDGKTRLFWPELFKQYWAQFPWHLPLTEDPAEGAVLSNSATPEQAEEKAKVTQDLTKKIKTWFNNRRAGQRLQTNAFAEWLTRLRAPGPAPKKAADYHKYMRMDAYKDKCAQKYKETYPDQPHCVNRLVKVARELFEEEPAAVKTAVRTAVDEEYVALREKYNSIIRGDVSEDPEDQRAARTQFSAVVTPLLEALRAHTGYYITVIAACRDGDDIDVITLNEGKTQGGKDLTMWDEDGYKTKMLDQFVRFVFAAGEEEDHTAEQTTAPESLSTPGPVSGASRPADTAAIPPALLTPTGTATPPPRTPSPAHAPTPAARASTPAHAVTPPPRPPTPAHAVTPPPRPPTPVAAQPPGPRTVAEILASEGNAYESDEEFPGVKLHRALRAELREMAPDARRSHFESLLRLTLHMLACENNLARNRALLKEVVGPDVFAEEKEERAQKRAREEKKRERSRKKARRDRGEDDEEEWEESDENEDGSEGEDASAVQRRVQPARMRALTHGDASTPVSEMLAVGTAVGTAWSANATDTEMASAPTWVQHARKTLDEIVGCPGWTTAIELWWELEKTNGFINPVSNYCRMRQQNTDTDQTKGPRASNRPKQVGDWVQRARIGTPQINDLEAFVKSWWAWWTSINPSWRCVEGKLRKGSEHFDVPWGARCQQRGKRRRKRDEHVRGGRGYGPGSGEGEGGQGANLLYSRQDGEGGRQIGKPIGRAETPKTAAAHL